MWLVRCGNALLPAISGRLELIGKTLSHYEIVSLLGKGGMGEVYRAHDHRLGRDVALKTLPAEFATDPVRLGRFTHEARAVAAISHPNILTVFDVGTQDDIAFVVFELLAGATLRERLAEGAMNWRSAVEIAAAIADGLAAAHEAAIVHRDVKPENVMLTKDGVVKVLDFGLAHSAAADLGTAHLSAAQTQQGGLLGTPGYMSPEQATGRELDSRSDIFSLGCLLYEMLTHRPAFGGNTPAECLAAVLRDAPVDFAHVGVSVPFAVERVVMRCLQKRPEERFQSARDLAFMLRTLIASPTEPAAAKAAGSASEARIDSLAVLPLRNLAGDPEEDFFVDGLTEALIADLSGIQSVRVASRSSAMQYKNVSRSLPVVARELGVDAIVEGSVLRAGDRIRVTVELVHAATDRNLWAQSYERDLKDVLTLQRQVARAIVDEIRGKLSDETSARLATSRELDPRALEAYLKGRYYWNRRTDASVRRGIEYFNQAIDIDPTYALAHAGLADSYNILGFYYYLAPKDAFPRAKAAALRALELDRTLSDVSSLVGYVRLYYDWDVDRCEEDFRRPVELSPHRSEGHRYYGNFLTAVGRLDEALSEFQRASALDPLHLLNASAVGWVHYFRAEYDAALRRLEDALDMDRSFALSHLYRGWVLEMVGRKEEALQALEHAVHYGGRVPLTLAHLAHGHARFGERAQARKLLQELNDFGATRYVSSYLEALVHIALEDADAAFAALDRAVSERAHFLVFAGIEPKLDPLRSDPRFAAWMQRIAASRPR